MTLYLELSGIWEVDIILKDDDYFWGFGDDSITLSGGSGNDDLRGHNGDDYLYGNDGNDLLRGGSGIDEIWGDAGADCFDPFEVSSGEVKDYKPWEGDYCF